ncbi:hypothetical protein BGZ83_001565 [Gryganskiella cystojenkinii]|nr:hypothetical protein BGZ83_001565 [Gryganskiella cystojenkinii]
MRTPTLFAFFMAMFAMLCSLVAAESIQALEVRADTPVAGAAFEATLDLLVKEHADIVVKAYADVCTDANLQTDISTNLRIQITGLINIDFGLGTKLSTALRSSIKVAVRNEVDLQVKSQFTANLRVQLAALINKRCPNHEAACIKLQAHNIVKDAVKLTTKSSIKISDKVSASLSTKIKSAIDIQVKKFSIDLLLIKISVTGDVDVSNSVVLRFKGAADLCAKACLDISAKEVSKIKAICKA